LNWLFGPCYGESWCALKQISEQGRNRVEGFAESYDGSERAVANETVAELVPRKRGNPQPPCRADLRLSRCLPRRHPPDGQPELWSRRQLFGGYPLLWPDDHSLFVAPQGGARISVGGVPALPSPHAFVGWSGGSAIAMLRS